MTTTLEDVRAIALALPGTSEVWQGRRGGTAWRTTRGMYAWERGPSARDLDQLAQLGRSWPEGLVLGVRTNDLPEKEALIETYPDRFFSIPHFDGWPAVLVRLDHIDRAHLREVVTEAWLLKTPKRAAEAWRTAHG